MKVFFKKVKCTYMCVQVSVCGTKEKKMNELDFRRKRELLARKEREKKSSRGKFLNLKVLKFWLLLGKVLLYF
jgi:hypothetical protein